MTFVLVMIVSKVETVLFNSILAHDNVTVLIYVTTSPVSKASKIPQVGKNLDKDLLGTIIGTILEETAHISRQYSMQGLWYIFKDTE